MIFIEYFQLPESDFSHFLSNDEEVTNQAMDDLLKNEMKNMFTKNTLKNVYEFSKIDDVPDDEECTQER